MQKLNLLCLKLIQNYLTYFKLATLFFCTNWLAKSLAMVFVCSSYLDIFEKFKIIIFIRFYNNFKY